ncbi:hypothetical protein [Massilia sp. YIM B02443]|uniref:hypothetical protein n=1 Tax=Massilia sp. YIM B02443 TaxID=3050127 RepID=UPI0025B6C02A|nr:hypothetical protein [Massilia sp. YIM B02443]MDN4035721.1 hypothetical protein [Massilia sp. YIM B02443]
MNDHLDTANGKPLDLDALCARQRLAKDHAALFPTRLALARWRGGSIPSAPAPQCEPQPRRSAWFDRIQREHQMWLECGGFAQHEELPPLRQPTMWQPPMAAPVPDSAPLCAPDAQPRPAADGDVQQCGACN